MTDLLVKATERHVIMHTDPRAVFGSIELPKLTRSESAIRTWDKLLRGWCPGLLRAGPAVFMPRPVWRR